MAETQSRIDSALPDLEVASSSPPDTLKKVELDLDDAPFLQPDEPARPPAHFDENIPAEEEVSDKGKKKKKLLIIGAIAGAVLVIAAVLLWFFFFNSPPPPPPPEVSKPDVVVVPSVPAAPESQEIIRSFAPFVVPISDGGKTNFLICQFSAIANDPKVNQEITRQMLPLRDAIYFYLRGKESSYLVNASNAEAIKKDLVSIFNDYLSQGKIEDIVLESYLNH